MRKKLSGAIMTLLWAAVMPDVLVSPAAQESRLRFLNAAIAFSVKAH
jgi:hypothetical protein